MRYDPFPTEAAAEAQLRTYYDDAMDPRHVGALLLVCTDPLESAPEYVLLTHLEVDDYPVVRETLLLRQPEAFYAYAVVEPAVRETDAEPGAPLVGDAWYDVTHTETGMRQQVTRVRFDPAQDPMPTHVARPDRRQEEFGVRHPDEPHADILLRFAVFYGLFGVASWFTRGETTSRIAYTPFVEPGQVVYNLTRSRYRRSLLLHRL